MCEAKGCGNMQYPVSVLEDTDQHVDVGHRVRGLWQSKAQSEEMIGGYLARKVGMLGLVGHLGAAIIRYMPGVTLTLVNTVSTERHKFLGRCYERHLALQVRRPRLDVTELHNS